MNRPCPVCRKPARLTTDNPYRPFCGARCKEIDLGRWAAGDYRVPTEERPTDSDTETDALADER